MCYKLASLNNNRIGFIGFGFLSNFYNNPTISVAGEEFVNNISRYFSHGLVNKP